MTSFPIHNTMNLVNTMNLTLSNTWWGEGVKASHERLVAMILLFVHNGMVAMLQWDVR